ncbi:DNA topoisomerase IV, alpha subunit [Ascobolus immersus RN42]|uniref:DNA topoisomerase (ATP-hydrolyzing) n=1 Tax=Ascobolus immersus RN42 TaxID=1160509 RepID=A0A3N4HY46_ASCIM|nr:DNA topoisomerase IV, alpha subunit [Ascobolus immersus RN42]
MISRLPAKQAQPAPRTNSPLLDSDPEDSYSQQLIDSDEADGYLTDNLSRSLLSSSNASIIVSAAGTDQQNSDGVDEDDFSDSYLIDSGIDESMIDSDSLNELLVDSEPELRKEEAMLEDVEAEDGVVGDDEADFNAIESDGDNIGDDTLVENPGFPKYNEKDEEVEEPKEPRKLGPRERKQFALYKVESMLRVILEGIFHDDQIDIVLTCRGKGRRRKRALSVPDNDGIELTDKEAPLPPERKEFKTIRYPGKDKKETWKFTVVQKILEYIREALKSGQTVTKRDIYYKNVALFKRQSVVDSFVDDIACTFDLSRHDFNVVASAKGLIFGPMSIKLTTGKVIDCSAAKYGTLIPPTSQIRSLTLHSPVPVHVLIIEKDATFQVLSPLASDSLAPATPLQSQSSSQSQLPSQPQSHILSRTILITAKGQPDLTTRLFLSLLTRTYPHLLASILTDLDPYGFYIARTYIHGSHSLRHELDSTIPHAQWIGLTPTDVRRIVHNNFDVEEGLGLLWLQKGEWERCERIVNGPMAEAVKDAARWCMAENKKAEMEIVGGVEEWKAYIQAKLDSREVEAGEEWVESFEGVLGGEEMDVGEDEEEEEHDDAQVSGGVLLGGTAEVASGIDGEMLQEIDEVVSMEGEMIVSDTSEEQFEALEGY